MKHVDIGRYRYRIVHIKDHLYRIQFISSNWLIRLFDFWENIWYPSTFDNLVETLRQRKAESLPIGVNLPII